MLKATLKIVLLKPHPRDLLMKTSFTLSSVFPLPPAKLFTAWLSSKEHSAFTGSPAKISAKVGGKFTAWDSYISGTTIKMVQDKKIVQKWRTTEFPDKSPDSLVTIEFETVKDGTKLILTHSEIPQGQAQEYKKGWDDFYFKPMRNYFSK
jgi:activator of HSP90 ATPase